MYIQPILQTYEYIYTHTYIYVYTDSDQGSPWGDSGCSYIRMHIKHVNQSCVCINAHTYIYIYTDSDQGSPWGDRGSLQKLSWCAGHQNIAGIHEFMYVFACFCHVCASKYVYVAGINVYV